MRIAVVTGGAGFIGRRLVQRMVNADWKVTVVDDFSTHDNPDYVVPEGAYLSSGKVQEHNLSAVTKFGRPDLIVHLAGKVGPLGVIRHRGNIAKDTIDAASTVADWALELETALIDISTSEVYGDDSHTNSEEDKPVIQHPSARSEYAVSKLAAEHMLLNRDFLNVKIIRPFNIAGYGQRTDGGFVIPRFIKQAMSGEDLTVYWPGYQQRSFTHVDDFIDGMSIVFTKGTPKTVYNVGNPYNKINMLQLANQIIARCGTNSKVVTVDPKEINGPDFVDAPDKIPYSARMGELGWVPYRGTGEIVQESIDYFLEKRYEDSGVRLSHTEQARPYAADAFEF